MFKEIRRISGTTVRAACIRHNWYTCGDNKSYYNLLETADSLNDVSYKTFMQGLELMARDIYEHSDMKPDAYGYSEEEIIANIMFTLTNDCTTFTYEVFEEGQDGEYN